MEFNKGFFNQFYWLETASLTLGQIVSVLPGLFIGKYLANVYFDGSPKESNCKKITDLNSLNEIRPDNFDQWVLTKEDRAPIIFSDYVNYIYFSLINWDLEIKTLTEPDEIVFIEQYRKERKKLSKQFWKELEVVNPVNFISDGSKLIFVSKNQNEIEKIISAFFKSTN